jgi:ADP-ribose pyrophosphatase YjhB (NUDIX family)
MKYTYGSPEGAEVHMQIMRTLEQHKMTVPFSDGFPLHCQRISVMKQRCTAQIQAHTHPSLAMELCTLNVTALDLHSDTEPWDALAARRWISVSVEPRNSVGSVEELEAALEAQCVQRNAPNSDLGLMQLALAAVQQAFIIVNTFPALAVLARFFPVVAGYPSWVRRLAMSESELDSQLRADIQRLPRMLAFARLPVDDPPPPPPVALSPAKSSRAGGRSPEDKPITMYRYALVMCRNKDGKFLCVLETRNRGNKDHTQMTGSLLALTLMNALVTGWWMPGGMVAVGESAIDGAFREVMEEAGVPVRLCGILQVQEETKGMQGRIRVIFYAEPLDDRRPKVRRKLAIMRANI